MSINAHHPSDFQVKTAIWMQEHHRMQMLLVFELRG
jgi:hypothetical protein